MNKKQILTIIFIIPMIAFLIHLGNWQSERLAWKLDLIAKIEKKYYQNPINLPAFLDEDTSEYLAVKVTGKFFGVQMPRYAIGSSGRAGYDLFAFFKLNSGQKIIINRGWIPEKLKKVNNIPAFGGGEITIKGHLRKAWGQALYGPENDLVKNEWHFGDLNAMALSQNILQIYPMFLYQALSDKNKSYPRGGRSSLKIVNNHLDYMLTWYSLAAVLLIMAGFFIYTERDITRPKNS